MAFSQIRGEGESLPAVGRSFGQPFFTSIQLLITDPICFAHPSVGRCIFRIELNSDFEFGNCAVDVLGLLVLLEIPTAAYIGLVYGRLSVLVDVELAAFFGLKLRWQHVQSGAENSVLKSEGVR